MKKLLAAFTILINIVLHATDPEGGPVADPYYINLCGQGCPSGYSCKTEVHHRKDGSTAGAESHCCKNSTPGKKEDCVAPYIP